jgi:uncharacterized protein YecT (DUF1311 family)
MTLISILLSAGTLLNTPDSAIHPIDSRMTKCLDRSHAIMPRADCYNKAYTDWEQDIKKYQNRLLQKADAEQRKKILAEEKAWEDIRDEEFKKIADEYNNRKGTGYIPVRIALRMQVLRKRALQLEKESGQLP